MKMVLEKQMANCPICISPLLDLALNGDDVPNLKPLRCGHLFHVDCCEAWFNKSKETKCPVCRRNHCILSAKARFFFDISMVDVVRLLILCYMMFKYWTGEGNRTYLYIIVDALYLGTRFTMMDDTGSFNMMRLFGEAKTYILLNRFTENMMHQTMYLVLIWLFQCRIWIPYAEFFSTFFFISQGLYYAGHLTHILNNERK